MFANVAEALSKNGVVVSVARPDGENVKPKFSARLHDTMISRVKLRHMFLIT